ncbi:MAG: glycosyltransferase family 2 protein [Candidatus Omnitrophota bacterium]|jgi:glycosyltransferase
MKISIITAVLNNRAFIEDCIKSVAGQTYREIEHIIVDGGSTDGTVGIINKHRDSSRKVISEKDNGIYEALNKGIRIAGGEVIGILNSDDLYANSMVLEKIAQQFSAKGVEGIYGDLVYVDKENTQKIIRYWKAGAYRSGLFLKGWMPPHPAFFVKKEAYDKYGYFNTAFKISADYELMLRFLYRYGISVAYLPEVLVKMRSGGVSNRNFKSMITRSIEDYRAFKINGLKAGFFTLLRKKILKIPQFFTREERFSK